MTDLAAFSASTRLGCQDSGAGQFLSGTESPADCALSDTANGTARKVFQNLLMRAPWIGYAGGISKVYKALLRVTSAVASYETRFVKRERLDTGYVVWRSADTACVGIGHTAF
jgi:hypothetical protein